MDGVLALPLDSLSDVEVLEAIRAVEAGGQTDVDGMCLLCDYHHDRHEQHQWAIEMRAGIPWFIPPAWIDPERKPLRNTRFAMPP